LKDWKGFKSMNENGIALNWCPFTSTATGAARRAFELHRRMPDNLKFTAFVTGTFSHEWRSLFPGFNFVDTGTARTPLSRFAEGFGSRWRRLLRENGCGLWVTDTLPVIRTGNAATCITVHDLRYIEDRSYVSLQRYLLMKVSMAKSLARTNAVIAVSEHGAGLIRKYYPSVSQKVSVIPNAVARDFQDVPEGTPSPIGMPFVLCVGHLEKRKNCETLAGAFAGLSRIWNGMLVFAGKDQGSGASIMRIAKEKHIEDRVILAGAVTDSELKSLYNHCSAVVCPSLCEGFGITVLEGMAAGKPVIASAIPPHVEVAGGAAVLVPTGEDMAGDLEEALSRVLHDTELSDHLIQGGLVRAGDYTWDESAGKLEKLYLKLLNTRS
jgi:glycosyltransferase involved in cell wall biosynthesis